MEKLSLTRSVVAAPSVGARPVSALSRTHGGCGYTLRVRACVALLALAAFASAQKNIGDQGVEVQIKSIANFRGVVANQLLGVGIVTGLPGTGDSKKSLTTQKALLNLLRKLNMDVDPLQSESKSVALVTLTAELPAFSTPGGRIDVTASIVGDCTSLRGGTLIYAPLKYPGSDIVYATAAGALSVGGFSAKAGGNAQSQNIATVGKLPGGGLIERSLPTQTVFDGKMYLDLQVADATTAQRMEEAINKRLPEFHAAALGAGTIELTMPKGLSSNAAQARIGGISVLADTPAMIVIDEKDGTVIMGGDVRVAPCSVVKGGLSIRVTAEPVISQPAPLSNGKTVVTTQKTLDVGEQTAEIATIRANTSVADLAVIFRSLRLKADDVINILRAMHEQGALKAKLVVK